MDKTEKEKMLKSDIKDDAEESEKKDREEDKDYDTDKEKHTTDREKFMQDDAERAEQDSKEEDKDYSKLRKLEDANDSTADKVVKDDNDFDKRYVLRSEYEALTKRLDEMDKKYGGTKEADDPYKDLRLEVNDNPIGDNN